MDNNDLTGLFLTFFEKDISKKDMFVLFGLYQLSQDSDSSDSFSDFKYKQYTDISYKFDSMNKSNFKRSLKKLESVGILEHFYFGEEHSIIFDKNIFI
ncbi:hypothetical protein AB4370_22330, partial [Vibrio cyclitrophicus]